jgi:cellobiose-specific phosphotransferase system component IIC
MELTRTNVVNRSSAIFALIFVLSIAYYFVRGRKIYRGPAELVRKAE